MLLRNNLSLIAAFFCSLLLHGLFVETSRFWLPAFGSAPRPAQRQVEVSLETLARSRPVGEMPLPPAPAVAEKEAPQAALAGRTKQAAPEKKKSAPDAPAPVARQRPESVTPARVKQQEALERQEIQPIFSRPAVQPAAVADDSIGSPESSRPAQETAPSQAAMPAAPAVPVVVEARPLYRDNPPPPYPRVARKRGQQGTVVLRVEVDESGAARSVVLQNSSGFDSLDQAALKAVAGWRFEAGSRDGVATAMEVLVPVRFVLEGKR